MTWIQTFLSGQRLWLAHLCALLMSLAILLWLGQLWQQQQQREQSALAQLRSAEQQLNSVAQDEQVLSAGETLIRRFQQRGWLGPENRLAWMEIIQQLRSEMALQNFTWHISPQSALNTEHLSNRGDFQLMVSHLHISSQLRHEQQFLDLMTRLRDELPAYVRTQRCALEAPSSTANPSLQGECELELITFSQRTPTP